MALRAMVFVTQAISLPEKGNDYNAIYPLIIALILLAHGAMFIWQIVGVLRAAENYSKETGSQAHVWGAQLCLVVAIFITFSASLEAWQTTIPISQEEHYLVRMDREHASKYELKHNPATKVIAITGSIELGITRNLKTLLAANSDILTAHLTSDGGNIYEARGLAKLFRDNNINTHVNTNCSSACTIAFAGGKLRTMDPDGKFGFHQYRIDSAIRTINSDPQGEQNKDKELFKSSGVSPEFVEKMFDAPPNEMWFPTIEELLQSEYVHQVK